MGAPIMAVSRKKTSKAGREVRVPQQARSRRTREQILAAAVSCFEELGYDETTTAQIARRARIGVGTLYGYFRDKREIILELMQGTVKEIADHTVLALDPEQWREGDPRAHVRALISALFHTRRINPGMQRILWERYFKDPTFRAAVEAIERQVRGALVRLLWTLRAEKRLRVSDIETAAFLIYTSIEWTASRLILGNAEADIDAAVAASSEMVSRYIFP